MALNKFDVRACLGRTSDAESSEPYEELRLSITNNGYQWSSLNIPLEKWPDVLTTVYATLQTEANRQANKQ